MNWERIREKSPKALKKFYEYFSNDENLSEYNVEQFELEIGLNCLQQVIHYDYLENFFDKQEIFINILTDTTQDDGIMKFYSGMIYFYFSINGIVSEPFKTRKETKDEAFLKAFEILEDKSI